MNRCPHHLLRASLLTGFLGAALAAAAVTDDFNDGNDDGWTHYSPLAAFGSGAAYSFPEGAYQIVGPGSPAAELLGVQRAGSLRADAPYLRARVAVDITRWSTNINQSVGLIAHAGDLGLGTTRGYTFNYNSFSGYFQINLVANEQAARAINESLFRLDPSQTYRLIFTVAGGNLLGQAFATTNLSVPLHSVIGQDGTYGSGIAGVFAFALNALTGIDARFDNYAADSVPDPVRAALLEVTPTPDARPEAPIESVAFQLGDMETFVDPGSVQLEVDGAEASPLVQERAGNVLMARWTPDAPLAPSTPHRAKLTFADEQGTRSYEWTFGAPGGDPAGSIALVGAEQPGGPYVVETAAAHDPGTKRFTVAVGAAPRFFRVRDTVARRLTGVSLASGKAVIAYE